MKSQEIRTEVSVPVAPEHPSERPHATPVPLRVRVRRAYLCPDGAVFVRVIQVPETSGRGLRIRI